MVEQIQKKRIDDMMQRNQVKSSYWIQVNIHMVIYHHNFLPEIVQALVHSFPKDQ